MTAAASPPASVGVRGSAPVSVLTGEQLANKLLRLVVEGGNFGAESASGACEPSAQCRLLIGRYLPIFTRMPRRKPGSLLPLETEILEMALSMLRSGHATFHGFGLAQTMREQSGSRSLTAHGTLYKALSRLEEFGLLTSHWEDAAEVWRRHT